MINWWLITWLVLVTLDQLKVLMTDEHQPWIRVVAMAASVGLMYMAGIYTELWSVYK